MSILLKKGVMMKVDVMPALNTLRSMIGAFFASIPQIVLAILVLVTQPFRIGDEVEFGGERGVVEDIQIRATVLRGEDRRRVVIPNTNLFTQPVIVHSKRKEVEATRESRSDADSAGRDSRMGASPS
jgi:small conductance mechanosensitive channel